MGTFSLLVHYHVSRDRTAIDHHQCDRTFGKPVVARGQALRLNGKDRMIETAKVKTWVKRLGFWGCMFLLVKGLLWLAIPALIAILATD